MEMVFIWIKRREWPLMRKVSICLVAVLVTAACGSGGGGGHGPHGLSVVASTSVWGSVASAVAGDHAQVKSIVTSAVDDPHSFEASPANAAAISDASLVVYNGGGYDHFVDDVLAQHSAVKRVDAFTVGGHRADANPHVFYDLPTVSAVANAVADQLAGMDAAHAADYRANADKFIAQANGIESAESAIAAAHSGAPVLATEDVPHYLIAATRLTDRTPDGYYRAIDGDTDPAPADLAAILDMLGSHRVKVVFFNPQTRTAATQRITDAAKAAGVPIVDVSETLPENTDFLTWQRGIVDQLVNALNKT
jgi:zinc/manganese transport system substrate-binding protein